MKSLNHKSYHQKLAQELSPNLSENISRLLSDVSYFISESTETAEARRQATTMEMVYEMMHCVEDAAETGRSTTDCAAKEVTTVKWSATPTAMQCLMTKSIVVGGSDVFVCATAK